jgi:hypothetical protein
MKYLFLFILLISCLHKISAQGNLQYNQVLYVSSTLATNNNLGTVPAGKVWKIESVGGASTGNAVWFKVNGVNAGLFIFNTTNAQMAYNSCRLPMWFPAGTQIGYGGNDGSSIVWFSIIEFNVVP